MPEIGIIEGCEPFKLGSGPVGALLVHGYTGSPQGMRGLGEALAEGGLNVHAPRLPGHGTTWQDLDTKRAEDWLGTVEGSFEELAEQTEEVFLVALSFGAALCLDLAARYPERVAGLVTISGLVDTRDPRRFVAPLIARIVKSLPGVGDDIADPAGKEIAYDRLPSRSTLEMVRFLKRAKAAVLHVRAPILIAHARQDHVVPPWNAQYLYDHVGSTDKELLWLDRSYHVVTLDFDRDLVSERTLAFIKERASRAF